MLTHELIRARDPQSRRLLVVLHGLGDSMDGYRWMPGELGLPWLNYLLVNAPDDYFGGYSWYDIYGDAAPGVARSRRLLTELLDSLPPRGFESAQTALLGFSQGCLIALETGLRHPRRLAGLIGVSGYIQDVATLLQELSPASREQRILMTHGRQDPLIPIEPVRKQAELLRQAGLDLTWREFDKPHTIAGEEELAVIREFIEGSFRAPVPA
jgi:phospholipase/carboxylesterase